MILAVDDEELVLRFVEVVLSRAGFRVIASTSGTEALHVCEQKGVVPELCVLDVVMPGLNGPALLAALRRRYNGVPFVFISGYALDQLTQPLEHPISEHQILHKPFTAQALVDRVREALESKTQTAH